MKRRTTFTSLCLALALASGAAWAAGGKTSEDTAPATPGIGSPPSSDSPGVPSKSAPQTTDPASANGALDMRHVEKKPATKGTHHKKTQHTQQSKRPKDTGAQTPANP